jgi:CHAT domain-containing protein
LVSPDGPLARVPFAALPGGKEGTYLIEDVALAVVPVPAALPDLLAPIKKEGRHRPSLLVVGDVNFDSAEVSAAGADERAAPRGALKGWRNLPATSAEADAVKGAFSRLFKGAVTTELREVEATKKAVRDALTRHRYAHLATHGFFAPAELKSALDDAPGKREGGLFGTEGVTGWHPLLLSGLVLAGANREPKPGEEDGVLTALEVSELDLSKLELAVLSACETGLGKVAAGEGVLGLQRAFQVAGCRSTITSLWKVDDEATRRLMTHFYRVHWGKKAASRAEALRQAQLELLKDRRLRGSEKVAPKSVTGKPSESAERTPPYYWAAFVLAGDWR